MHYDELTIGDEVAQVEFEDIPADNMSIMSAIMDDPNPIHWDRRAIENMGHPGLVNQGTINMAYTVQAAQEVAESPLAIKSLAFRYQNLIFEGDSVTAIATVTDKYENSDGAFVDLDLTLEKDTGETAVTGTAAVGVSTDE